MKLCKDCKHELAEQCFSPHIKIVINRVNGEQKREWKWCSVHRESGWLEARLLGICGENGRWWEPK